MTDEGWNFEHSYAALPQIFYRNQTPATAPQPEMVIFNHALARDLGLNASEPQNLPGIFSGTELPRGANPISQAYAGFQFGHFARLGDGRAILLGEQITPDGSRFDIHLKGAGRTPFSRGGDGLAALLPMLREYIVSEAMFALGIPSSRSLAVVRTGADVIREKVLPGAVLTRVAQSHIRVGTFDYISAFGSKEDLSRLSDYCIWRHFPQLESQESGLKYLSFLRETARLQAALIARWQLTGFVHGVMNTDNMAISGETIDYGPCAFMDTYDPDTVFSSIDTRGRYSYKNQPAVGAWNLSRFAEAILPLLHKNRGEAVELANAEIARYWESYNENWLDGMRQKLGLCTKEPEDSNLADELLGIMKDHKLDFTITFRSLINTEQGTSKLSETTAFAPWNEKWKARLKRQVQSPEEVMALMEASNPAVIPRNHLVEEALSAADSGDISVTHDLLAALRNPFTESPKYSLPPEPGSPRYRTFCGT